MSFYLFAYLSIRLSNLSTSLSAAPPNLTIYRAIDVPFFQAIYLSAYQSIFAYVCIYILRLSTIYVHVCQSVDLAT